jgi:hypothetical protein
MGSTTRSRLFARQLALFLMAIFQELIATRTGRGTGSCTKFTSALPRMDPLSLSVPSFLAVNAGDL